MQTALEGLPDDPAQLKAIILAQREEALRMEASVRAYEALVQALKIRIARLKKQKFGPSSEKTEREIEQLQLALEDLEVAIAGQKTEPPSEPSPSIARARPQRRGKPRIAETTPRERIVLDPGEACPDCGGALRLIGEDVAEILEFIEAKLKVVETARLKKSCRRCEKVVQTPAPTRPVARGMAGPGLLAHILVAKYDDHLPLYRQGEIFARMGAEIPRSTLIDWCGQAAAALRPLVDRIRDDVFRSSRLHADDTPIRVLDPSVRTTRGKTRGVKEGRIWVYVRDDRTWSGADPPAAAYIFSPDRKGAHPTSHLRDFSGILQADAYAGFRKLYQPSPGEAPKIREAACWAHLRRDFHDVWKATGSPIAEEALQRIGALYDIERDIWGKSADGRRAVRQEHSLPRAEAFRAWCEAELARIPAKSDLAKAMRYALARWPAFTLFLEDGRVAIDNNAAERAIRPIAGFESLCTSSSTS
jgi:transposase